jgi:Homeodomain-like domain/Helix-turn-helix domain
MDRSALEAWIAEGLSLEEMGRCVERHPSTVSYWLRKHGLEAVGADVHSARGALDRDELAMYLRAGFTIRDIAEAADRSTTTVRHWLRRYGLQTYRSELRAASNAARADGLNRPTLRCDKHGPTLFGQRGDDPAYRCLRCRSEAVTRRRRRVKAKLVEEAGGQCAVCGYDRHIGALQFHHLDPGVKRFTIAGVGVSLSLERARHEVEKCILLCANCHAEVEGGLISAESPADRVVGYRDGHPSEVAQADSPG